MIKFPNTVFSLLFAILLLVLSGCDSQDLSQYLPSAMVDGISATLTARVPEQPEPTVFTPSPTVEESTPTLESELPVITPTAIVLESPTPRNTPVKAPCNLARAGNPLDITMPDGSQVAPGQPFSKTWRIYNAGSCTWTTDYAVVWFSGFSLTSPYRSNLHTPVKPGEWLDVTVDLVAPEQVGMYQSNWKLQDPQGELFGLGPNGDSPFWVRIEVFDQSQPPTVEPEPTETPLPPML